MAVIVSGPGDGPWRTKDSCVALNKKQVIDLRARAHHLSPSVKVGQSGITDGIIRSLDARLTRLELVKVSLGGALDTTTEVAAKELAKATKADLVQVVGRCATFFRTKPPAAPVNGAG